VRKRAPRSVKLKPTSGVSFKRPSDVSARSSRWSSPGSMSISAATSPGPGEPYPDSYGRTRRARRLHKAFDHSICLGKSGPTLLQMLFSWIQTWPTLQMRLTADNPRQLEPWSFCFDGRNCCLNRGAISLGVKEKSEATGDHRQKVKTTMLRLVRALQTIRSLQLIDRSFPQ
jgi:hypothetical protein